MLLNVLGCVAVPKTVLPVPLGVILISALLVLTKLFPLTSKSPPNCGVVSPTTSVAESDIFTVLAVVLNVAKVISSVPS